MNYSVHYERMINKAGARELSGYVERHHIIPKCLGGGDTKENRARLTPEEHYVAHQLLVKMHPDHNGLLWSACAMTNGSGKQRRNNKLYGWLRRRFAERISASNRGQKRSEEARKNMSAAKLGQKYGPHSEETKAKMSAVSKGKKKSAEHCAALSRARLGVKRGPPSVKTRKKMSEGNIAAKSERGKWKSEYFDDPVYREGCSIRMKELWLKRKSGELPMPNHTGDGRECRERILEI